MNRAASKSYSDGVTPAVTYTYGESILPAACLPEPGRWRLRPIDDGDRHSPERHHDCQQLFRLRSRGACEDEQPAFGAAPPYTFTYNYDLSGALSSVTYPSLRTVTNAFDAAGRIAGVTGTLSAASTPYASSVAYAPQVRHRQPESVQWHRRGRRV